MSFQNFRLCKSRRHPFSTSVESVTKPTTAQLHCTDMRVYPFIQGAWPIVKLKLVSQPLSSKLAGLWRRLAPIGHEFLCLCSLEGRRGEGRGGGFCTVSLECGGRARLVASWPPAPDGCIIDAHPSSRAAGATGRVQCDGAGRDWDTALTAREGGFNH